MRGLSAFFDCDAWVALFAFRADAPPPGVIATDRTDGAKKRYDRTPSKRRATPDDMASAVLAIGQDAILFSTGEVFKVDDGFHFRRL